MQIVIDIPDDLYYEIQAYKTIFDEHNSELATVINDGKLLPKGHGKLKDFDKIEWYGCDFEGRGCIEAKGDCKKCNFAECYAKQVRELPTIIEAERSKE